MRSHRYKIPHADPPGRRNQQVAQKIRGAPSERLVPSRYYSIRIRTIGVSIDRIANHRAQMLQVIEIIDADKRAGPLPIEITPASTYNFKVEP